jgi:hypothetical protein
MDTELDPTLDGVEIPRFGYDEASGEWIDLEPLRLTIPERKPDWKTEGF